jgi:alpha-ketoglutarate-dependent taurine dioxygenase
VQKAGATLPIHSLKACVVYDTATGRIHHIHRVMTLEGGREPSTETIAEDALRALRSLPNPPDGALDILHVHHDAIEPNKRYRVNLRSKTLVAHH